MGNTCCSEQKSRNSEFNSVPASSNNNRLKKDRFSSNKNNGQPACCRADNEPLHLEVEEDDEPGQKIEVTKQSMADKIRMTPNQKATYDKYMASLGDGRESIYLDSEFKPEESSITKDIRTFDKAQRFVWRRAEQFLTGSIDVFKGSIEPNDIKQGSLGDCYFLSALSALAEFPNLISRLFITQQYVKSGKYCVWLCHDGEWKTVVIDDYFPCSGKNEGPAFSRGHGPELWVLIMEKAYAKIFGAYDKIEAGLTGDAIRDLTGAPYQFIDTEDVQKVWAFVKQNDELKHILTAGSNANEEGIEIDNGDGIISGHAYAVLEAREVTSHVGLQRIVKLRNPWGSKEWEGDWSDKSDRWTLDLKKKLNWSDKDDGIFWMTIQDFCKKFSDVSCNQVKEDNFYSFQKVVSGGQQYALFNLKVENNNTQGYVSLVQRDKRNFAKMPGNQYAYSYMRLFLVRGNMEEVKCFVAGGHQFFGRQMYLDVELMKGDYMLFAEIEWAQKEVTDFVVSTYTDKIISFDGEPVLMNDNKILDSFFFQRKSQSEKDIQKYPEDDKLFRVSGFVGGYLYFNYINSSSDATLYEKLTMTKIQNLNICEPFQNSQQFEITVAPGEHQTVKYQLNSASRGAFSYSFSRLQQVTFNDNALISKIKANPKQKDQRKYDNQLIEVYLYSFFYSGGMALLYENQSEQTYVEEVHLKLKNLKADGFELSDPFEIQLTPKTSKLLKFQEVDPKEGVSYGMSYSFYLE